MQKVFQDALDEGKILAPAKNIAQMKQIIFNDYIDADTLWNFHVSCHSSSNFCNSYMGSCVAKQGDTIKRSAIYSKR